jgi:2,3-bisphosphoglycerate-dependent phosphoglycerate mutase
MWRKIMNNIIQNNKLCIAPTIDIKDVSNTYTLNSVNTIRNKFLLVRHGESIWNKSSKFTGWTNIPLTNYGRQEASIMAHHLLFYKLIPNIIFTSVLDRSIDTSDIIKHDLENNNCKNVLIHTSWRLNEKHYGNLEGVMRNDFRKIYGDKFTNIVRTDYSIKPPIVSDLICNNEYPIYKNCYMNSIKNGESKEDVLNRLLPYYENDILYTLSENKFPLIVTHKHCARVLMKHLLQINETDFLQYKLPEKTILLICLDNELKYKTHFEIPFTSNSLLDK